MSSNRKRQIIRISSSGILLNVFLVILKLIVGLTSHSLAIVLDAVNNLGDAISSVLTMIGTKIAGLPANRKYPFGYGRVEYLVSIAIATIIFITGLSSLRESVLKLITPSKLNYTWTTIIILIIACFLKFVYGKYCQKTGRELNAQSLRATGEDSILDAYISIGTLIAVIVYSVYKINIDSYLGILISLLILKTAFDILKETLGSIIGIKANYTLIRSIENEVIKTDDSIKGAYDLILHDYGPNEMIGSIHIEVDDDLCAKEIDCLTRKITERIYKKFSVILTVGIYAANNTDEEIIKIKQSVNRILSNYPMVEQMHGLYVDKVRQVVSFDLIIHYECMNYQSLIRKIENDLKSNYPDYSFNIVRDFDLE